MGLHCWNQLTVMFLVLLKVLQDDISTIEEGISNCTLLQGVFFEENWSISLQINYAERWNIPFTWVIHREFIGAIVFVDMLTACFESKWVLVWIVWVDLCNYIHYLVFMLLGWRWFWKVIVIVNANVVILWRLSGVSWRKSLLFTQLFSRLTN